MTLSSTLLSRRTPHATTHILRSAHFPTPKDHSYLRSYNSIATHGFLTTTSNPSSGTPAPPYNSSWLPFSLQTAAATSGPRRPCVGHIRKHNLNPPPHRTTRHLPRKPPSPTGNHLRTYTPIPYLHQNPPHHELSTPKRATCPMHQRPPPLSPLHLISTRR